MKTHTNDYKNNIKEFGREIDVKITYSQNNETIELGADELFSANLHYEGAILKSVMKQLDIDSKTDIPLETILNAQFGLKVNGQYEYINLGNFIVYKSEKQEDTDSYKLTCYDKMLYAMKDYEALGITYPITIRNYINALCTKIGLPFANASDTFANYDKELTKELFLDSQGKSLGYIYRDVLDQLAEVTASTICINDDGELEIRYITNTNDTINEDYLKDINVSFGEKFGPINSLVLSRAADADITNPIEDAESIAQNGICQIKIKDNKIMNWQDRETYMQDIFDELNGLEYYINDFSSPGITYYDLCDRYTASIDNNNYSCIMLNDDINITQGLEETIYTDAMDEKVNEITRSKVKSDKIDRISLTVDEQEGKIEGLIIETQDLREYLNTVSGTGVITLTNTPNSNGAVVNLEISGFSTLALYPGMAYPSDNVYPTQATTYVVVSTNGINTDECYIDLGTALSSTDKLIIKNSRVYIQQGNQIADTEKIVSIKTYDGNTTLSVKYLNGVTLNCDYIVKNDFTDYFASQAELNSSITQTSDSINLKVDKKLDGENFTGANIMLEINKDKSQAAINADKISLAGKKIDLTSDVIEINSTNFSVDNTGHMTAQSGKIGGYIITDDSLYAENYAKHNYSQNDLDLLQQYLMGQTTLTDEQKEYLDANDDGVLNSLDLIIIKKIIIYSVTTDNPLKIIINSGTNGIDSSYEIIDGNNVSRLKLSVSGITAESVSTNNIDAGNIDYGTCTLNSNSDVSVAFNKTFASTPRVVLTPNTTTSGVIAPKIREVTTTEFKAIIGGSGFSNIDCDWIAIS